MQAVILAAGIGRRMQPISQVSHKALLPIAGSTILARLVDELVAADIGRIAVVTGYRAGDVRAYLSERYPAIPFTFIANDRFAETNNIVSLSLALDRLVLDEDLLLLECDLILAAGTLRRLCGVDRGNIALVDRYRAGMDGTVVSVDHGYVTAIHPPHVQGADFRYEDKYKTLNIYRFDRAFCELVLRPLVHVYAHQVDAGAYYELVLGMLGSVPTHRIAAEMVQEHEWAEVDDPIDLAQARFLFEPHARAQILERSHGGHWGLDLLDFGHMRNARFPTPAMLAAVRHALPELIGGYGSAQAILNEKLAWWLDCPAARVQVLHGASQAYPLLADLWSDRIVAIPEPTFGEYRRSFPGARTYRDRPGIELAELEDLTALADVLVLVNPNNPTGTTLESTAILGLAERHPDTQFLIDESFIAFSGERSLIERAPLNVHVLASLGKALGVPGLRLGYVYSADPALPAAIGERLPVWNLSAPAEFLLELLFKFRLELEDSYSQTIADRQLLTVQLAALPGIAEVHPSGGNFLLVRLSGDAQLARLVRRRLLAEHAIEVKDVSDRFDDGAGRLRIAVRLPGEHQRLLSALESVLSR